jgi:hypothetical protein
LILMGACHIPPDDTPLPPDVPPIAAHDLARVVDPLIAENAIARSNRPLLGIADLIAAGYGFRLRSSSCRSKRFGVTLGNYRDNLPIRRIRSRRRQRGWRSPRPPVR